VIWSGNNGGGVPRVPISNTTVKPSSANGTWTAGSWESRTLPGWRTKKSTRFAGCFFVCGERLSWQASLVKKKNLLVIIRYLFGFQLLSP
jgi:hypothetical protein